MDNTRELGLIRTPMGFDKIPAGLSPPEWDGYFLRWATAIFAREIALASVVAWVQRDMETGGRLAKWLNAPTLEDRRREALHPKNPTRYGPMPGGPGGRMT